MIAKLLTILLLSNLLFAGINSTVKIDYNALDKISTNNIVRIIGNKMAKSMPFQLDYLTKVTRVFTYKNTITTYKEIDTRHIDFKRIWSLSKINTINAMFKQDSQVVCYNKITNYMIVKRNIILKYNYLDKNNRPLFEYTVEKEDCLKIK